MKIDVSGLIDKLDEGGIRVDRERMERALVQFARIVMAWDYKQERTQRSAPWDAGPAAHDVFQCYVEAASGLSGEESEKVLDSLRHAFCSYADGGLHQLFTRQECEDWYPKVILQEVLTPNDIARLPRDIVVYRGASADEFFAKKFGQSWTTCKEVARNFAFTHYSGQPWFEPSQRLVLQALIFRDDVYFSDQSHCEREVVVNVQKLRQVEIITDP